MTKAGVLLIEGRGKVSFKLSCLSFADSSRLFVVYSNQNNALRLCKICISEICHHLLRHIGGFINCSFNVHVSVKENAGFPLSELKVNYSKTFIMQCYNPYFGIAFR